jgi:hypothetical protein
VLYDEFVESVGQDRYRRACEAARRTAASTGRALDAEEPWPDDLADVPHDLADLWFAAGVSLDARLEAGLRFLAEMPCYANTMYMTGFFAEMAPAQRTLLWAAYREALEAPGDGRAAAIAYSLWVDYFEDPTTSAEAFAAVTAMGGLNWDRRIGRVLSVAGPVPWRPKQRLLEALLPEQRWHSSILLAIEGSLFDVYGQAEPDVMDVLERLQLPDAHDTIDRAREAAARLRA